MPYDLKTKSGLILRNIPDDMSPDAPELRQLAQQHLAQRQQQPAPEANDAKEIARMAGEGMSGYDKVMTNLGAGFDTFGQGVKQLAGKVGIGEGVSDEDVREKRARDAALADQATGGSAIQMAGEALPTMVVPFGTAAKGAALGLRVLPKAGAAAARAIEGGTGRMVADSALMGAAGGALGPVTSDESRLRNAALGGTIGAVLPAAARTARGGYEMLSRGGAANKAAREVRGAVGDEAANVEQRLRDYARQTSPDAIPLTSAAASGNADLARMEAGARARNGADFYEFDQNQGRRVSDAVMRDTAEAEQLAARRKGRSTEWDSNWGQAQEAAQPEVWAQKLPEFRQNLDVALRAPEASNPAVRNVINEVRSEIDRLGPDFTPAHLQQIRANLNARGKAIPANAYQAAPRESPAVSSLMQEVDDVMNATTNGAWGGVTDAYATSSRGVDASKAAGRVRDSFIDSETGRVRGTALDPRGDVPMITEAGLGRAMDRAVGPDKVSQLAQPAQQGLSKTLEALRQQGIVQRVKKSATAGGGSNTASDTLAARALEAIPGAQNSLIGSAISGVASFAQRNKDRALAEALRDPAAMQALMQRVSRNPGDLGMRDRALLQALRSSAGTSSQEFLRPDY